MGLFLFRSLSVAKLMVWSKDATPTRSFPISFLRWGTNMWSCFHEGSPEPQWTDSGHSERLLNIPTSGSNWIFRFRFGFSASQRGDFSYMTQRGFYIQILIQYFCLFCLFLLIFFTASPWPLPLWPSVRHHSQMTINYFTATIKIDW